MPVKKISILAIEDNIADCRLIEEILKESENFNYKIQFAHNLADGISMISDNIDIILLDLNLPDSNGIETLKKIQKNNFPIIILSGIQDIELANESIKFGAQDYLVKGTFDFNLLIRSINYSIERFQINKKIIDNEENFKTIIENNADCILIIDKKGIILYANKKAEEIYNKCRDKLVGSIFGIIDVQKAQQIDIAGENNNIIFAEANAVEITWKNEKVYLTTLRDITPHIHLQKLLQDSKLELLRQKDLARHYLDIAGVIILVLDKNGNVKLINKKGCEIIGLKEENMIGKNWFDNFVPESLKGEIRRIHKTNILNTEKFIEYHENTVITSNNEIKYIAWHNSLLRNDKNKIHGVLCSGEDITKRRQVEEREKLVREILELLNRTKVTGDMVRDILYAIKKSINFDAVGIRLRDGDDFPYYETNGFSRDFINAEQYLCEYDQSGNIICDGNGNPVLECMCGNILCGRINPAKSFFTKDGSFWTNSTTDFIASTTEMDRLVRIRNCCNSAGYESVALIPLKTGEKIIGLLQLNDHSPNRLTLELIRFFEGLGDSIGIALSRKQAEEALKQSELYLNLIIERTPNPMWISKTDGTIIRMNQALRRLLDVTDDEIIGKYNVRQDMQVKGQGFLPLVESVFNEGRTVEFEIDYYTEKEKQVKLKKKTHRILNIIMTPILDDRGKLINVIAQHMDITERKQAEEGLRISEERFRKLVASLTDYIYTVNVKNGNPVSTKYGQGCISVTGYSSEEFEKDPHLWYNIIYDEDKAFVIELASKLLTGKETKPFEHRIIHKNGSLRWVRSSHVIRKNNHGEIDGYDGLIEDITERKYVEEKLRLSEVDLKKAQQVAHVGSWKWDIKANRLEWSDEMYKIFGFSKDNFSGSMIEVMTKSIHPEDRAKIEEANLNVINNKKPIPLEYRVIWPDKSIHYIWAEAGEFFLDENGNPSILTGIAQDITERKTAEEEIKKLNKELEQKVIERTAELIETNKELESFSYSVSHDLRAPLRSIDGFSHILLEEYSNKLDKEGNDLLNRIQNSTQFMNNLIEDLLALSKVTRYEINYQTIDLTKMVNYIIFEIKKNNPERKVNIIINQVPEIESDLNLINIAMTNLISNAWKFTGKKPKPKIELGSKSNKNEIIYFIKDNGAGFNMKYADKLFGAFQRLHTQKEFPGTGIGLAIVKRIFTRLGGRIWAEAKEGKGATFYFVLPKRG